MAMTIWSLLVVAGASDWAHAGPAIRVATVVSARPTVIDLLIPCSSEREAGRLTGGRRSSVIRGVA